MMTLKERLLAVIKGEIPDRIPATIRQWQPYHLKNYMKMDDDPSGRLYRCRAGYGYLFTLVGYDSEG